MKARHLIDSEFDSEEAEERRKQLMASVNLWNVAGDLAEVAVFFTTYEKREAYLARFIMAVEAKFPGTGQILMRCIDARFIGEIVSTLTYYLRPELHNAVFDLISQECRDFVRNQFNRVRAMDALDT
jgi:hypothetical protein